MAGLQVTPGPDQLGIPTSFAFGPELVFPGVERPVFTGSQQGVPAVDKIAGQTPDAAGSTAGGAVAYGEKTTSQAPHKSPILWSFVLVAIGAVLLTHAAKVNVRGL